MRLADIEQRTRSAAHNSYLFHSYFAMLLKQRSDFLGKQLFFSKAVAWLSYRLVVPLNYVRVYVVLPQVRALIARRRGVRSCEVLRINPPDFPL